MLKKTPLDLQKRFPIYHTYPKYLAAYRRGLAFPQNGFVRGVLSAKLLSEPTHKEHEDEDLEDEIEDERDWEGTKW